MKRHGVRMVLAALGMVFGLLAKEALAAAAVRGEGTAVCVDKGPALDGTMRDKVWEQAPRWPLGQITANKAHPYETYVRVLFDPTHVYVGFYCAEPDTANMPMKTADHDGEVFVDDSVEIFLRADPEQPYYQFIVNPKGVLYDGREKDGSWNSSAEVKTSIQEGQAWLVTFRVPLKELSAYVGEDETWTMNFNRTRQPRGDGQLLEYSWAVMSSKQYHVVADFGLVTGVKVPKRADGVTRERSTPPPKPKVAEKGTVVGGVTIYRKHTFDQGEEGWTGSDGGKVSLVADAADGKALHVDCLAQWSGAQLPLVVGGSQELRLAFLMKGFKHTTAELNVFDTVADDNTTSFGYRHLYPDGAWTPVLYYLDRFRYNGAPTRDTPSFVTRGTFYNLVRFFGPAEPAAGCGFTIDNFVLYRGADKQPPEKVTGLKAEATGEGLELAWEPAKDNVAPMAYVISRAGAEGAFIKIAESHQTRFCDRTAGKEKYRYRVFALDFEENFGPWAEPVAVKGKAEPKPKPAQPTLEEGDRLYYTEHVRAVHAAGAGKVRKGHVALFGDSLTFATSYWTEIVGAFRTLTVDAFGYPGTETSFGKKEAGRIIQEQNPEFIFVLFGTNNILHGKSAQAQIILAMEDLESLVKTCEANGTVMLLGTIPPHGFTDPACKDAADYNKALCELAKKLQVPVGHIFEDFQALGFEKRDTCIAKDGVHWGNNGFFMASESWGKALAQVRFALRDQP